MMVGNRYPIEEQQARAIKATRLLDVLERYAEAELTVYPLTSDVVRALSDDAWLAAEKVAGVNPASATTRELVADLADTRAQLKHCDPFDIFPGGAR